MVDVPLPAMNLRELAVLLDIDGTILDIAPTPGEVYVPATLRQTLARLSRDTGGALALVSGRSLGDIDRLFAPLRLPAVGGHGAELRPRADGDGSAPRAAPLDRKLRRQLAAVAQGTPGVLVEDKGYAFAMHYRLAPEQEGAVKTAVAAIQAEWPEDSLEVLPGKAVLEIKSTGFNKGAAIRALMQDAPFAGRRPIFIGDDTTDESAFAVLPAFDGLGFSVGRVVPGTSHCFAAPGDVRQWLERLSQARGTAEP
ncbi:MAG TPA: trehalose-phosphatase [Xanthobacteraceae bacterium]|nr:trehalose-phosphatase [Xanthobacteraceae bacterium]